MGPGAGAMASAVAGAPLWRQQDRRAMVPIGLVVELWDMW